MNATKRVTHLKPRSVAEYITMQIGLCGKSQLDIAKTAGFDKPNIITMIKQGKTKLPLDKIGKFAKAIEVDPVYLFGLCMNEYWPDTWASLQQFLGKTTVTQNEGEFISVIRESNVINPKLNTEAEKAKFLAFVNTLKGDNAV